MSGIELLEKYPLTAKVVNEWVMQQMLESFKDDSVPQEFKDYMLQQGVENDKLAVMIDTQPRFLFDVFDHNDVIIQTLLYPDKTFTCIVGEKDPSQVFSKTRRESEKHAIEAAFDVLEEKLGEERMKVIAQNGNTGEHYDEI
jgi:hypothetical protein